MLAQGDPGFSEPNVDRGATILPKFFSDASQDTVRMQRDAQYCTVQYC